jgi:hypothetical protein
MFWRVEARGLLELVRQGNDPKIALVETRQSNLEATRQKAALGSFAALLPPTSNTCVELEGLPRERHGKFYGFSRTAFGMVKTRTNGERLLIYTDSGT